VLSGIVMKLLSKASDERYQTAAGLQADLERCLAQWRTAARIDDFQVGSDDVRDQLVIAEKIYGREKQARALLDAFERVAGRAGPKSSWWPDRRAWGNRRSSTACKVP